MSLRIDNLNNGDAVRLDLAGDEEVALFVAVNGEGNDRRATFVQVTPAGSYEWDAYRYNGGWAFGTSADRLRLVEVIS